jgi:hypothetical protein
LPEPAPASGVTQEWILSPQLTTDGPATAFRYAAEVFHANPVGSMINREVTAGGVDQYVITPHALSQMERRGIDQQAVTDVVTRPEQRIELRSGRVVLQSRMPREARHSALLRVFVDLDRTPAEVVTAYITTKVSKYWKDPDEDHV